MRDTVQRTLRLQCQVPDGTPLWVAVSGGVDSMVLLHVLHALHYPVSVLHVDHGLRGSASDADRALVEGTAAALGVPCRVERVNVAERKQERGVSVQMAARAARYEIFQRAVDAGPSQLAMAHHADDAVETLLMQLLRGMGADGWGGIPLRSGPFIRPLLGVPRTAIEAYAAAHGVPYREDVSNTDPKYLRNRIRQELMPLLEGLRPGARQVLQRNAMLAREINALAIEGLEGLEQAVHCHADGTAELPFAAVEASNTPMLLLTRFTRQARLHPDIIGALLRAVQERHTGARFAGEGYTAVVDRTSILLAPAAPAPVEHILPLTSPWPIDLPVHIEEVGTEALGTEHPVHVLLLDTDAVEGPLRLRPWRIGDRIAPSGMRGTKLISDLLVEAKVPLPYKHAVHVLADDRGILWCCGLRRGGLALPGNAPRRLLKITWTGTSLR
jgi:tRNA(Ile)-lysidine synthase